MGLLLKEALRRLCVEIGWSYAVFWKEIGCDGLRHLVWEEGHHESTRVSAVSGISGHGTTEFLLKKCEKVQSFHDDRFGELRCEGEDKVGNMVKKIMLPQVHMVGDGMIGCAAVTGNYQWIHQNSFMGVGCVPECLTEVEHQFLAGIQTIAVIPVLPHGVVQLGSNQMIMENTDIVNHVRNLFVQLCCVPGILSSDSSEKLSDVPITSKPIATILPKSVSNLSQAKDNPMFLQTGQPEGGLGGSQVGLPCSSLLSNQVTAVHNSSSGREYKDTFVNTILPSGSSIFLKQQLPPIVGIEKFPNNSSTDNTKTFPLRLHGYLRASSQEDSLAVSLLGKSDSLPWGTLTLDNSRNQKINSPGIGAHQMIQSTNHSSDNDVLPREVTLGHPPAVNKHIQSLATLGTGNTKNDLLQAFDISFKDCWLNNANPIQGSQRCQYGVYEENDFSMTRNGASAKSDDNYKPLDTLILDSSDVSDLCTSGNDLFDALRPNFKSRHSFGSVFANRNGPKVGESGTDASTCVTSMYADSLLDSMRNGISTSGLFSETGPDQLLDAVISKINSCSRQSKEESAYCKTASTEMAHSSISNPSNTGMVSSFALSSTLSKAEKAVSASLNSASSVVKTGECSQRDGVCKSQISLWVETGQNMKSKSMPAADCERIEETGKTNRKRPRSGENSRPRPKDRQMIQDRFKELREIVPNGTKLSIDALLERTIKHMLFLQSVTKHADKLKETGVQKIISKEGGLLLKDNFEGGATWAFEIGTESMICPIIVEDLNPPRQLLVEMLCEERGFFLEIASLIRELGLTILKGVMESRKHKLWARFAVEANKDVTRMDIFLSLLQLLEPTLESCMLPHGNVEIAHDMICQSSVPATGLYSHMQ